MSMRKIRWLLPVAGIVLTTWVAMAWQGRRIDQNVLRDAGATGEEWITYGLNLQETRYSPLRQIDASNVNRLGLAWTYEIGPGGGNQEATPLFHNGVIYSITNWSITFAVDARTGREIWRYDPQVDRQVTGPKICCGVVNRGIALYDNKVYVPVIDGRLVALDLATGKEVWSTQTVDTDKQYTMTMAPRIAKDKVIVGNSGAERPVRGYFSAYDTATGKLAWRFYTVPGDPSLGFENKAMEMAAKTWSGEWWKMGGGATVWDAITYDPDTNLVFVGTGNGFPWPEELRSSGRSTDGLDNLFVASVVAVDADSGEYKWHYQFVPGDSWDFDSVQQLTVADVRINNQVRKVVMQANKNGFFYVLDRTNGKLISAAPFAQVNWASEIDLQTGRPVVRPEARYGTSQTISIMPGPGGAHNWAPMSYNPGTGMIYIPASTNSSYSYAVQSNYVFDPSSNNLGVARGGRGGGRGAAPPPPPDPAAPIDPGAAIGAGFAPPPPPAATPGPTLPVVGPTQTGGWLIAWDVATQTEKWRAQGGASIGGGTVTTAGNLVFQTLSNGTLRAFSADKGETLFSIPTGQTGGMGPPITYMLDGKQYVAVAGGRGGNPGGQGGGPGRGGAAGGPGGPAGGPGPTGPAEGRGGAPDAVPPAPQAPATPPVLPRLYVYTLDGNAPNPTPAPPAAATPPAPGADGPAGGNRGRGANP